MDEFDDTDDTGTSSSALTALLQTASQIGTTALVANSSQPIVVQGPNGLISNTPGVITSTSSTMMWLLLALAAVVVILIVR